MVNPEAEPRLDFDQPTDEDFKENVSEFYDFIIQSEPEGIIKIAVNFRGKLFDPPRELVERIAGYCSEFGYKKCLIKNPSLNKYCPIESFQTAEINISNIEKHQKRAAESRAAARKAGDPFGVEGNKIDGRYMNKN